MIGNRVKELRKSKKLSQEELGKKLDVVKQTISAWETEKYDPDYATMERVASFFGVTVSYLTGNSNEYDGETTSIINLTREEQQLLSIFHSTDRTTDLLRLMINFSKLDDNHKDILLGHAAQLVIS